MKKTSAILVLLATAAAAFPAAASARPAPDFKIAKVLNAPVDKVNGLKDLKGKVVFLDFWATWCGACVASMPHMNRLHDALKGEPVVFIAVTDESAEVIKPFLKTHEIKSWVGLDTKSSSLKAYKVKGRPDGYLIGKNGELLARIFPAMLDEKDVRDALAGKFTPRPVEWETERTKAASADTLRSIFEIKITSAAGKPRMSSSAYGMELNSVSFAQNIAHIWDMEYSQVILDTEPVTSFNITLKTPKDGYAQGREALKAAVQSAFRIRVATEPKETDVYILELSSAAGAPRPKPGAPEVHLGLMSYGGGSLVGTAEMPAIAKAIWMSMDKPVVDETGLKGAYEFDLHWEFRNMPDAEKVLGGEGLVLTPGRRTIEFLRVTAAE
ncbi:MAG: hypothetical protein A3J79_05385 [Elusimicrobia bacterium RIFOXYB2_FULL_62_6]|nr:MAG: hypothetical protein A3J79_05385 [Elusimicrobia bacterium RIFOXYB2_FULL_62_6]